MDKYGQSMDKYGQSMDKVWTISPKWGKFQRLKLEFWKNLDAEYFILSRNQRELGLSETARKTEHFKFYCYRT